MSGYIPISCDLHDRLEILATYGKSCSIVYQEENGGSLEVNDKIVDIYTKNKEEFILLGSNQFIRLDRLITVDGQPYKG
ncbi:Rho-binding antiterminator [Candidatus Nitrosacidococcus sp. I8]|uniref:Rho-binding antiterminator n=1 Tax=Candidatus Nitrosacidococcus sp. I8 TaxID=2942908 RepID=UPI0022265585|nr:Rho-binding antiterminator [Candidatus Nitrosacidococcus sp. I8]CAH9019511.1 hypothetical protein NURINAE_01595 [Candidatus Nitrosacidococcus sp. I8]